MNTIGLFKKTVGSIKFEDGLIDITDPCYDNDVSCRTTDTHIKAGEYNCYAYICTKGDPVDIGRCFISRIVHTEYDKKDIPSRSWKQLCSIGVDAGRAGYFSHKPNFNADEWMRFCDNFGYRNYMITDNICKGFFTASGYGDGRYDVYAYYRKGEIVALEIRF